MFLGIEIGGTKLQLGIGPDDGTLEGLWRGVIDPAAGPEGIRRQIVNALPELLAKTGLSKCHLRAVGIGFGGPVDDATHTVIKSHQIAGWDGFPLADWVSDMVGLPAVLGNDADVAGLAEALHGAGKGLSPIFYITIGSGIGGGLIIAGEIYRGCGKGAAEIGHLFIQRPGHPKSMRELETEASGWGIERRVRERLAVGETSVVEPGVTAAGVARGAEQGDRLCQEVLSEVLVILREALCHLIALLCPRRIVIGGGVSLMGEQLFFEPLRRLVRNQVFPPFRDLADIVPAALGEQVVVHGAIALARKQFPV